MLECPARCFHEFCDAVGQTHRHEHERRDQKNARAQHHETCGQRFAAAERLAAGLLDRLIETALRCPTANIEIAGHTDSDGDEAANQALSERRAKAVADYLVKAGLPDNRCSAVGYGATQPIAGNDTDQGKAQNRRIDFVVK